MLNLIKEIVVDWMLYQPAKEKSVVGHLSKVTVDVCDLRSVYYWDRLSVWNKFLIMFSTKLLF